MAVSRATVNNLLAEARRREVVTITVSPGHLQTVRAARRLAERYRLAGCVVVPDGDPATASERIGHAGALCSPECFRPATPCRPSHCRT